MKMPGNHSADNGIYEYEDNSFSLSSEEIETNGVEEYTAPPENDFSEYLWMENEEEFDKEVMQKLEEEALMEQCIEAFMNDENSSQSSPQGLHPTVEAIENSKLNPEAAEFVPSNCRSAALTPQEVPVSSPSSS